MFHKRNSLCYFPKQVNMIPADLVKKFLKTRLLYEF